MTSKLARDETIRAATDQALAVLRRKRPQCAADHEDFVNEALAYVDSLPVESYVARVTKKADWLALQHLRKLARHEKAVPTSKADRPLTLDGLRAATIAECQRRLFATVGEEEGRAWLKAIESDPRFVTPDSAAEFREAAKSARAVLLAVKRAHPWVAAALDVTKIRHYAHFSPRYSWHELMRGIGIGYGADGFYGEERTEAAVLSILAGSWPKVGPGLSPAEVIAKEADNIDKARRAHRKREAKEQGERAARRVAIELSGDDPDDHPL